MYVVHINRPCGQHVTHGTNLLTDAVDATHLTNLKQWKPEATSAKPTTAVSKQSTTCYNNHCNGSVGQCNTICPHYEEQMLRSIQLINSSLQGHQR